MNRFRILFLALLLLFSASAFAQTVVATNGWTAAYALAAGAPDVVALAPYESVHPPEYELRPSDLRRIMDADLVLYAGYEVMVDRLLDATAREESVSLRITTGYTREILTESIRAIATAVGTPDSGEAEISALNEELDTLRALVADGAFAGIPVLSHFHQQGLAREIGLNVVGVFGPAALEARQLAQLTAAEPVLIIDNAHNPLAGPLEETTGATVVTFINFPGTQGTLTLLDVLQHNRAQLVEATP